MRPWIRMSIIAVSLLMPIAASAAQPKCPLDMATCLKEFDKMRQRPWLGVRFDTDSLTGKMTVIGTVPGSPAQRAGIKPGDELQAIDGQPPKQWFATKAGWGPADKGSITILRGKHEKNLALVYQAIPEDLFARIVGEHMIEAHLAYMPHDSGVSDYH